MFLRTSSRNWTYSSMILLWGLIVCYFCHFLHTNWSRLTDYDSHFPNHLLCLALGSPPPRVGDISQWGPQSSIWPWDTETLWPSSVVSSLLSCLLWITDRLRVISSADKTLLSRQTPDRQLWQGPTGFNTQYSPLLSSLYPASVVYLVCCRNGLYNSSKLSLKQVGTHNENWTSFTASRVI